MPHHNRRHLLFASGATALLTALGAGRASAQTLELVKIITGFPPGGTSDTLCRRVAEGLRGGSYTKLALVENKAGAGGQIAIQSMKGAPTDGSVILQTPASMLMIYPHIYKKLAYDPFTDVTPITMACTFDFALAVGPAVPARTSSPGARRTRPWRTSARRRRARCRISSACCSASRPASS
jgi:tripartite-type tricarboxylate transporter receptor subunit TctC